MANNTGTFFNINDNDGIPLVGVSTDGKVMINHLYGNCLIGSTSVTGTAAQPLQVTGGAHVSGNLGIGTTNPTVKLQVQGDGRFTGVVTATSFTGSLTGTASTATTALGLSTTASVNTSGIITASSFVGGLVGIASTATTALGLSTTASVNTSGIITASSFVGSLTGTASTATTALGLSTTASVNTSGIITASSFVGSLTGTASTANNVSSTININTSGIITATGGFNIGIQSGGTNITTGVITAINFIGSGNTFSYNSTTRVIDVTISASSSGFSSVSISTNTTNQAQYIPYTTSFGNTTGFGATTLLVYNPSTGNLGIGTTNPTTRISIAGTTGISFGDRNIRLGNINTGRAITSGVDNFFAGYFAGQNNVTGSYNNFFGVNAGLTNNSGFYNNFFGYQAGYSNSSGSNNNFFGQSAGFSNTGGDNNFLGQLAGINNTSGSYNNFFGYRAGNNNNSGSSNIFLGQDAGFNNVTGSQNIVIGYNQNTSILNGSNQLVIGAGNTAWIHGNSSYNIGIGTTRPTSRLSVVGDGNFTGIITATGGFVGGLTGTASTATTALGFSTTASINTTGIITATSFTGNLTGTASTATNLANASGITTGIIARERLSGTYDINISGTLAITGEVLDNLTVTGFSTFTDGPVVIGSGIQTGTSKLQVSGNTFITGSVGIGTTNPTTRISIAGTTGISFGDTNIRLGDADTGSSLVPTGDPNIVNNGRGTNNFFAGLSAGKVTTTGYYNNFIGWRAGYANTSGYSNNFIGVAAGYANTSGRGNDFIGGSAGLNNTTGDANLFIGGSAGQSNTTGSNNIFVGLNAGLGNQTGSQNVVIGSFFTNYFNPPILNGSNQLVIGAGSTVWIHGNSSYNVGFGTTNPTTRISIAGTTGISFGDTNIRLGDADTGSSLVPTGDPNSIVGNGRGVNNFFAGLSAGKVTTSGAHNNFIGWRAGYANTSGLFNNFIGWSAGYANTSGLSNNFIGAAAGIENTTGGGNNFIGDSAGAYNTSGNYNTFVGSNAGLTNQTGNENVIIGYKQRDTPILNGSNQLVIGAGNTAWIYGNSSYNVGFGTTNPTAKVHIGAATTSAAGGAPLKIGAGTTILTTPEAGAIEYDGTVATFTPNTSLGRAVIATPVFTSGASTSSNLTLNTNTPLFPPGNDTITLPIGTYLVETAFQVTVATSTVSSNLRINMQGGGTAVGTHSWTTTATTQGSGGLTSIYRVADQSIALNAVVTGTNGFAGRIYIVDGKCIMKITTAGTIIPSIQWGATLTSGTLIWEPSNFMVITPLATSATTAFTGAFS